MLKHTEHVCARWYISLCSSLKSRWLALLILSLPSTIFNDTRWKIKSSASAVFCGKYMRTASSAACCGEFMDVCVVQGLFLTWKVVWWKTAPSCSAKLLLDLCVGIKNLCCSWWAQKSLSASTVYDTVVFVITVSVLPLCKANSCHGPC